MKRIPRIVVEATFTSPYRCLALAVLERAVADILTANMPRGMQQEAQRWLFSDVTDLYSAHWWALVAGDEDYLMQFRNIVKNEQYGKKTRRKRRVITVRYEQKKKKK